MNKKLLFPLALFLAFSLSCGKKEDAQQINPCVEDILSPFPPPTCSDVKQTDYFCDVEFLGKYQLEESSKLFQPQYCEAIGNKITYKNDKGTLLDLAVYQKGYGETNVIHNSFVPCAGDTNKYKGYCIDYQQLWISLRSDQTGLDISMYVLTAPDYDNAAAKHVGDFLKITRKKSANAFWQDFYAVINRRSLSYDKTELQEYYPEIELLGRKFTEVISNDISLFVDPKPYKYYFNKEVGLIGFVDSAGVLWVIES